MGGHAPEGAQRNSGRGEVLPPGRAGNERSRPPWRAAIERDEVSSVGPEGYDQADRGRSEARPGG
ncbi:hypothetical protein ACYOEI_03100, partial [Singulisphaera rosea]